MFRFIYRSLVRLHPAGFRRRFSEEMLSIFDQAEETRGAAKLVADVFISFCRQWALHSEYWKEKETEPLYCSVDGVPVFYTLQSFAPRTSALINGGLLTLLMFCAVCLALKYNWTHPVHLRFSGVQFGISNEDLQPAVSPMLPEDGTRARRDWLTNPERPVSTHHLQVDSSQATQSPADGPGSSRFEAAATPEEAERQTTLFAWVRSYCATKITPHKPETVQDEHQFATQMAIARFYFLHSNYSGAAAHYRLALQMRPNDPDATFGFAQSLEKTGRTAEAQSAYRAYLIAAPNGHFAEQSKTALHRFEQSASR